MMLSSSSGEDFSAADTYLLAMTDGTTIIQVHSRRCLNQLNDRKLSCKHVEGWLILVPPYAQRVALPWGQG